MKLHKHTFKHLVDFESICMMVGAIIGAGVLGIPYVVEQSGIIVGLIHITFLGVVMCYVHLMVGEIALRTRQRLHIPGLAKKYLGPLGGTLTGVLFIFSGSLALLAYTIASGLVLFHVLPILNSTVWSIVFFGILSLVVYIGLSGVKITQLFLAGMMFVLFVTMIVLGMPYIVMNNFSAGSPNSFFLPFGIILFALGGSSVIPEMKYLFHAAGRKIERTLLIGTAIPAVLYAAFAFVTVGVTGSSTTSVATVGLGEVIGYSMVIVGSVFALLAMGTSFISIGLALRRVYEWDMHLPKIIAFAMALFPPFIIFVSGARNFIQILGFAGTLGSGLLGILIVCMFWKARKRGNCKPRGMYIHYGGVVGCVVILTFLTGILITLAKLFNI